MCLDGNCTYVAITPPTGNLCFGVYCDPVLGVTSVPTACPGACSGGCNNQTGCSSCPKFSTIEKVATGLGAGAIAGIVVGIVIFAALGGIGGKKGYDTWAKNRNAMNAPQTNSLYTDEGRTGTNPMHE